MTKKAITCYNSDDMLPNKENEDDCVLLDKKVNKDGDNEFPDKKNEDVDDVLLLTRKVAACGRIRRMKMIAITCY